MREYRAAEALPLPPTGNLTDDVVLNAEKYGDDVGFSRRVAGRWVDVTWADFHSDVVAAARGLIAAGVRPGERVALLSRTRYEWTVTDYAIWFTGAVTVPVYETSSADQLQWILGDSEARLAVVETASHAARLDGLRHDLPALRRVVRLDTGGPAALAGDGSGPSDEAVQERRTAAGPGDLATLLYTSGTTGRPKGCALTHGNFMAEIAVTTTELRELFDGADASTVLFLPLAHVLARIVQVGCVRTRARLGYSADIGNLVEDLAGFQPTFVLGVPRVFEKIVNTASQRAASNGKADLFNAAVNVAVAYSRALDRSGPGPLLLTRHAVFERLVYAKLRTALGGRVRYAVSGGAPLGDRLAHFYRGVGLPVLEGYGLTETSGAVTVNRPDAVRVGTVGRPLSGTTIRVSHDGELLVRGGQVFAGYWRDDEATAAALVDGWLHTGDLGEIDPDGYLSITGRKKEILVTASGKNVAPAVLEERVRAHELVSQCMVVGDGKPFVAALVTLDRPALDGWLKARGRTASAADLVHDPQVRREIQRAVDEANATVSRAEQIRRFAILTVDWSEQSGELTPTLKVRRGVVQRAYYDDIEALYL